MNVKVIMLNTHKLKLLSEWWCLQKLNLDAYDYGEKIVNSKGRKHRNPIFFS